MLAADQMVEDYRADLEAGNHVANALVLEPNTKMFVDWSPYLGHDYTDVLGYNFPDRAFKRTWSQTCVSFQKAS